MLLGPNCPIGNFSVISVAETQVDYIMKFINEHIKGTFKAMSPKQEVMKQLGEKRKAAAQNTIWTSGYKSWYLDKNGNSISLSWSGCEFRRHLQELRLDEYTRATPQPIASEAATQPSAAVH